MSITSQLQMASSPAEENLLLWSAACITVWQSLEKVHWIPFSDLLTCSHAPLAPASSIWCLADHSLLTFHLKNERLVIKLYCLTITNWAWGCLILNYHPICLHCTQSGLIYLNKIKVNDLTHEMSEYLDTCFLEQPLFGSLWSRDGHAFDIS